MRDVLCLMHQEEAELLPLTLGSRLVSLSPRTFQAQVLKSLFVGRTGRVSFPWVASPLPWDHIQLYVDKQLTSQGRKHDWHDTGIKFVAQVITGSISLSLTVSGCSCLTFSREMLKNIFSASRWSFSTTKKGGGTGVSRYWESCFLLSFHRSNAVTKQGLWCSTYYSSV